MTTRLNSEEQTFLPDNPNSDKFIKIQNHFFPKESIMIWTGDDELREQLRIIRTSIGGVINDISFMLDNHFKIGYELNHRDMRDLNKDLYHLYELETLYMSVLIARNSK
jgi:hypothetical protein